MHYLIGTTAGQIWKYLDEHGTVTVIKLKSALGISNSLLYLALGWLAREDQVDIVESDHTYKVYLKRK